jgi:predicted nucleic acid-binding protein
VILVDSSVWIDFFNGTETAETQSLSDFLGLIPVAIGDLMLAEVLQGFRKDRDFQTALHLFDSVTVLEMGGREIAARSAKVM